MSPIDEDGSMMTLTLRFMPRSRRYLFSALYGSNQFIESHLYRTAVCTRTVPVVFDNAKLLPGVDILEEDFVVVRILAPSSGWPTRRDCRLSDIYRSKRNYPLAGRKLRTGRRRRFRVTCMVFGSRPIIDAIAVRQIASTSKAGAADASDMLANNIVNAIDRRRNA
jgi:hypothetical protein